MRFQRCLNDYPAESLLTVSGMVLFLGYFLEVPVPFLLSYMVVATVVTFTACWRSWNEYRRDSDEAAVQHKKELNPYDPPRQDDG